MLNIEDSLREVESSNRHKVKGKGKGRANDGKSKCKHEDKSDPKDEEVYLQSCAAIVGNVEEDTQEILDDEGEVSIQISLF